MGELIVNGIKIAFIVGLVAVFTTAIVTILNMLTSLTFGGVVSEILGIMGCCLPFDLQAVMSAIGVSIAGILSFMVANKIYNLTSQHVTI